MVLFNGVLACLAFASAIFCVNLFVQGKERSALVMAVIALVAGVNALFGVLYPSVALPFLPVTAVTLAAAWVMVRGQRKSHT